MLCGGVQQVIFCIYTRPYTSRMSGGKRMSVCELQRYVQFPEMRVCIFLFFVISLKYKLTILSFTIVNQKRRYQCFLYKPALLNENASKHNCSLHKDGSPKKHC